MGGITVSFAMSQDAGVAQKPGLRMTAFLLPGEKSPAVERREV
jgi:hypothetical protein